MGYQTFIRKPILHGTTPQIRFQIVDPDGVGFAPDTLTMTIYDVQYAIPETSRVTTWPPFGVTPLADVLVNDRDDVDLIAYVDSSGNVEFYLEAEDTEVDVPVGSLPSQAFRRLLFTWTWDSPVKVGKHEVILTLVADREVGAA